MRRFAAMIIDNIEEIIVIVDFASQNLHLLFSILFYLLSFIF